jgi:HD domain
MRGISDRSGVGLVGLAALLVVVGSVAFVAGSGELQQPGTALVFAAFIAVGELFRITLPGDREEAPLATGVALAYALLVGGQDDRATYGIAQVVGVVAVGTLIGLVPHVVGGRAPRGDDVARRVLVVAAAAAVFRPLLDGDLAPSITGSPLVLAGAMVAVAALAGLCDIALAAIARSGRHVHPRPSRPAGSAFLRVLRDEARARIALGSAIGATGVLIALAAGVMSLWALPVFAIPLLLAQFAFRRWSASRATYLQTIQALSRVTEVGGYTETGHARRVAELAVAVGRDLGMSERQLLDLQYAALMHDLGQLSLPEPIPGGATTVADRAEQIRIAVMGADVVRQTGVLDRVAEIVERQAEPYRRPHVDVDPGVPLSSRVIRAVNAYDDLVGDSSERGRALEALERLRLGMAYEYDPLVVESLSRVVARSTAT